MAKRYYVVCKGYTGGDWATANPPLEGKSFDSVREAFDAAKAGEGVQPDGCINAFFNDCYYIGSAENAGGPFKRELKLTESTKRPASEKPKYVPIKSARSFRRYKAAGYTFEVNAPDNPPDAGWIIPYDGAEGAAYHIKSGTMLVRAVRQD